MDGLYVVLYWETDVTAMDVVVDTGAFCGVVRGFSGGISDSGRTGDGAFGDGGDAGTD